MSKIGAGMMYGLMRGLGRLPLGFHYSFARFTGWFMSHVLHYRESVVYINFARAYPEKKYKEIQKLVKQFYVHFGEIIAETIWFAGSSHKRLRKQNICTITNPEVLDKAYKESPSVMLLTSHCGNWELLGGVSAYNNKPEYAETFNEDHLFIVYKELTSKLWDEVMKKNRTTPIKDFKGLIESKHVLRFVIRNRKNKGIYVFIADQKPYGVKTEVGDFMHQHTYGMVASFGLAHKLGMSLVYSKMVRTGRGHYDITFVPLVDDASQYEPEELMKMYFKELEKELNETPVNWLWSHKRWNQI